MTKTYYAGMDIDAPCGRCKGETRHRVLTLTNGVPDNLICANCKSVHKFRPDRTKAEAAPRIARGGTSLKPRPSASPSRFQELMTQEQAGSIAKPYSIQSRWDEGDWMDHPSFGLGKVQKRLAKKVDVLFRDGLKTLISA
ncbi:MAG: hypothetical protein IPQ13_14295 [Holophagaceae bacterium]|nr:hypothetical protein [Holophagaceae bacterium]